MKMSSTRRSGLADETTNPGEPSLEFPDESSPKSPIRQRPCLIEPSPALDQDHPAKQCVQRHSRVESNEIIINLSSELIRRLNGRAMQQWRQQQSMNFIRQLIPRIRWILQEYQTTNAYDTRENRGNGASSLSIILCKLLHPSFAVKVMQRSWLASSAPILRMAMDHATNNATLSIDTETEAQEGSSPHEDQGERPQKERDEFNTSPTSVDELPLPFSDEPQQSVKSPPASSSNFFNPEQSNRSVSREDSHLPTGKEGASCNKCTDNAVSIRRATCRDSLDNLDLGFELIRIENDYDYLKISEKDDDLCHQPPCESKLKVGRGLDAAATGDQSGKSTKPFSEVVQLYHGNPRPGDSSLLLDDSVHLLAMSRDARSSPCNAANLDLVIKDRDCDESTMSEVTFTLDAAEEERVFGVLEFVSTISNHILENLDLLCL